MKKLIKLLFVFLLVISVSACNKQEGETPSDAYAKLADKTFYNIYEVKEKGDHSYIIFNSDKSFVMNEIYPEGSALIRGTYSVDGDAITCKVAESGTGEYNDIVFSLINDNVINLKTSIVSSSGNDTFICAAFEEIDSVMEKERANLKEIISGKTFNNEKDRFQSDIHASISFVSDGTFEMNENSLEGFIKISGTWEANEYKINCLVDKCEKGDIAKISFYVSDFNTIMLETDLFGSIESDYFVSQDMASLTKTIDTPYGYFVNASHIEAGNFGYSNLDLRPDGSFTLIEVVGMGATEVNGLYGREGDVLMFSNFEVEPYDMHGNKVSNFEMRIISETTLELMVDLEGSYQGNYFILEEYAPKQANAKDPSVYFDAIYKHEPIQDVLDEYLPTIYLYANGDFELVENCYAGMGSYEGTYHKEGDLYILDVTDSTRMQGFMGEDVEQIVLELSNKGFYLHTDLCMSRQNDEFYLQ